MNKDQNTPYPRGTLNTPLFQDMESCLIFGKISMCPYSYEIHNTPYPLHGYARDLDNSTSNVLIPLDSWTSGLLVYRLPLSVEYGVSTSIGYGVSSSLSKTTYSLKLINTAYPLPLDMAYRSSGTETERHFKTLSLDELRLPGFNLLFDQEYSEEEEAEAMAETMEQYMSKTRTNYGSRVARHKIEEKDSFELKDQFLKEH
ncbi:hypothetical protein Tco_0807286 [Tanacetum coccineum]